LANIREFLTKWTFQSETGGLDKVDERLEKIQHRLEFLGAVEVIKGIVELGERFAHFAEELNVAAESAGITVEAFQGLAFAASQSAIGQDEMGTAMARLSRHLYDARMGSEEAQKAFMLAGFTSDQIMSLRTGSDALLALADKFKNISDPIQKQAMGMELLGHNSTKMVGFLSKGSAAIRGISADAQKMGAVLGGQEVEALVKLEHAFLKVYAIFKTFSATIAAYFSPSIETAINQIVSFYEVNKKLIDLELRKWIYDITFAMGFVWGAVKYVTQAFFDFAKSHEELTRRGGEFILVLGGIAAALWVVQKGVRTAVGVFNLLKWAITPVATLLTWLSAVEWAAVGPWIALGVVLAGIGVIIHDIWQTLSGGKLEDTWLEKLMGVKSGPIGWLNRLAGAGDTAQGLSAGFGAAKTLGPPTLAEAMMNTGSTTSTSIGGSEVAVPVTIYTSGGVDTKNLAIDISAAVKSAMDRSHREAARSLKAVLAH
jgi:hypothetical protein